MPGFAPPVVPYPEDTRSFIPPTTVGPDGPEYRSALRRDAVHGLETSVRIVLPQDRAVLRRVGPYRAIVRSRKTTPGITVIAAACAALQPRPAAHQRRRRRVPRARSRVRQLHRVQPSWLGLADIGHGKVSILGINRGAVREPACRATLASPGIAKPPRPFLVSDPCRNRRPISARSR